MKRCCFLVLFSLFMWNIFAQDSADSGTADTPSAQTPITAYVYEPIRKGDQFIRMGLQLGIPLFNTSPEKFAIKTNIYPGGAIFLGYEHYLTKGVSLGGDLGFSFFQPLEAIFILLFPLLLTQGIRLRSVSFVFR